MIKLEILKDFKLKVKAINNREVIFKIRENENNYKDDNIYNYKIILRMSGLSFNLD